MNFCKWSRQLCMLSNMLHILMLWFVKKKKPNETRYYNLFQSLQSCNKNTNFTYWVTSIKGEWNIRRIRKYKTKRDAVPFLEFPSFKVNKSVARLIFIHNKNMRRKILINLSVLGLGLEHEKPDRFCVLNRKVEVNRFYYYVLIWVWGCTLAI